MTERRVLVCWALLVGILQLCHSFCSPPSFTKNNVRIYHSLQPMQNINLVMNNKKSSLFGKATATSEADDEDQARRPNIVKINSHEQYVKFLEEDDRVCVIKFYATWCKSCQRFGLKFRHLAFEEGDRISGDNLYHSGSARFAEVEYSAGAQLCKLLKVRRLPTVHMYKKGSGKIADMTVKPSLFHLVVDEFHRVVGDDSIVLKAETTVDKELKLLQHNVTGNSNMTTAPFNEAMLAGDSLGDEIIASLRKEKKDEKKPNKEKKKSWFFAQ